MVITNLGEGLVKLTPSVKGKKIVDIIGGRKYSEVVCDEDIVKNFKEEE